MFYDFTRAGKTICRANGHIDCTADSVQASCPDCYQSTVFYKCTSGSKVHFVPHDRDKVNILHAEICNKISEEKRKRILQQCKKKDFF